jgi:hypothetical protein
VGVNRLSNLSTIAPALSPRRIDESGLASGHSGRTP